MLNQPGDAKLRVHFYQAMNVVGHDFQSQDLRLYYPSPEGRGFTAFFG